MNIKVSIIVPAYNENGNIVIFCEKLKKTLRQLSLSYEIIIINDGSTDDTEKKARECGVKVITHEKNLGYGRSLKDGIRASQGEKILLIDADGTYDIDKIPEMLRLAKNADLVVGKRIFSQESRHHLKNVARRFFAYQVSYYAGKGVEDLNSGQRVFKKSDVIDRLDKFPDGFSFTSTLTVLYLLEGKKVIYTPVVYNHRKKGSKFVSRSQILAMTRLSLGLTFFGRPFKLSAQIAGIIATAGILSKMIGAALDAGAFMYILCFIILYLLLFVLLLCYIYIMGRAVVQRKI